MKSCIAETLLKVFGYFAGRRGVGCSLRDAEHGVRGAGCEMLSLILELQACQFCSSCQGSLTQKCLSHVLLRYTSRTNPHSTPHTLHPANHAPQPVNYTPQNR